MLQDMDEKAWILRPELEAAFAAVAANGLVFDALIKPPHLPHMPALLAKYPDLPIVVDHGAKPYIAAGETEPWTTQMRALARHPNLYCKFSGLVTEAGDSWDVAKLKPYVDVLIEAFGPRRLMWGSDWPVLVLAGDYPGWLAAARELTAHLGEDDRDQIFGGTAARFYGLSDA
jgi:L-fuconolactonase